MTITELLTRPLCGIVYFLTIRPRLKFLSRSLPEAKIFPSGSRYVCNPPVLYTDVDFLIYTEKSIAAELRALGFKESRWVDYSGVEDKEFSAWRKGVLNLIVTSSSHYAETFHSATHASRRLNVRTKYHRVLLHEAFKGNSVDVKDQANCPDDIRAMIRGLSGPHGNSLRKAYRAQHGLEKF